jgi:hypothetical protein
VVILLFHCYLEVFEVKSGSEKNLWPLTNFRCFSLCIDATKRSQ